jgi:HTH-type transcriptional regulator/antitoxin HipB
MDYPVHFVDQLREHLKGLRKNRGLTQAELGLRLGIGQARIAEIENDPGSVSAEQILKLLSALGAMVVLRDRLAEPSPPPYSHRLAKAGTPKSKAPQSSRARKTAKPQKESRPKTSGGLDIPPNRGSW